VKGSLPFCVGKIHGNGRSDLEDLAFPIHPPREADEIGRRVCLSTWRSIWWKNYRVWTSARKWHAWVRSYAGAKGDGEGMALKIWRERRHFCVFYPFNYPHKMEENQ